MDRDNIYPIETKQPGRFVVFNTDDAKAYAAAFLTAGVDFTVTYSNTINRKSGTVGSNKVEVWVFDSKGGA